MFISQNHNKQCVGENNCSDFERCSFARPELYANNKRSRKHETHVYSQPKKKNAYNPKVTVECGDVVTVEEVATQEWTEIKVSDTKNPFHMKQIKEVMLIRGEKYQIIKIKKH